MPVISVSVRLKLKNIDDSDNVMIKTVPLSPILKPVEWFSPFQVAYMVFDLSANFTYSIGNDVYNANKD